jgi:hypothetical protein
LNAGKNAHWIFLPVILSEVDAVAQPTKSARPGFPSHFVTQNQAGWSMSFLLWYSETAIFAARSPLSEHARRARSTNGRDRVIEVITFKTNFRPNGFDRPVTEGFKEQIVLKLAGAGVTTLTVIISRDPRRELVLYFDGRDEDVARAQAALNLNRETRTDRETGQQVAGEIPTRP